MNLLIWIIAGTVAGAIAGLIMRLPKAEQNKERLLNVVVGAVGALLGGSLLAPIFGTGNIDIQHYTNTKLLVAIASAIALLILVNALGQINKR